MWISHGLNISLTKIKKTPRKIPDREFGRRPWNKLQVAFLEGTPRFFFFAWSSFFSKSWMSLREELTKFLEKSPEAWHTWTHEGTLERNSWRKSIDKHLYVSFMMVLRTYLGLFDYQILLDVGIARQIRTYACVVVRYAINYFLPILSVNWSISFFFFR